MALGGYMASITQANIPIKYINKGAMAGDTVGKLACFTKNDSIFKSPIVAGYIPVFLKVWTNLVFLKK